MWPPGSVNRTAFTSPDCGDFSTPLEPLHFEGHELDNLGLEPATSLSKSDTGTSKDSAVPQGPSKGSGRGAVLAISTAGELGMKSSSPSGQGRDLRNRTSSKISTYEVDRQRVVNSRLPRQAGVSGSQFSTFRAPGVSGDTWRAAQETSRIILNHLVDIEWKAAYGMSTK